MLNVQSNVSLKPYNTFGIQATARYWADVQTPNDLQTLLQLADYNQVAKLILGGGSNLLLTGNVEGMVIRMNIQGIELVRENDTHWWVKAGAGVNWHAFVIYCVKHGYAGVENLSLIPGTVGAAPMQNIGAYGVEIEQVFESLEAVNRQTGEVRTFTREECKFGYRESVFKHELKDQYIITSVTFQLDKSPTFHTSYGAIRETLDQMGVTPDTLSIKAVSDAVVQIRRSKLPDPAQIGNAGSFFKNPEISREHYDQLLSQFPDMPGYPLADTDQVKVPAGWLIEHCGWKGYRRGDAGVHAKQALVLVNYGGAVGQEILNLAYEVRQSVGERFGITINPEVNIV
ncbi:MAG: UDP-N-acetylmuramate dehydrogenase [Cytophagales bacterium]|nr:MAG: UDP-N-acetylmuramate dehydrogenase [Cytophagales bacterium]